MSERATDIKAVGAALRADFEVMREERGLLPALGMVAMSAAIIPYQIGFAEASMAFAGANMYDATHNPLATGMAVGATSLVIESGLALGTGWCLRRVPKAARAYEELKYHGEPPRPRKDGRMARAGNAFKATLFALGLGSPGITLRSFANAPEKPVWHHTQKGLKVAGGLAIANTMLGIAAGSGLLATEKSGNPGVAEDVLTWLERPYTYLGIIAALQLGSLATKKGIPALRRKIGGRKKSQPQEMPLEGQPEAE